jgi:hypothetical protein
MVIGIEMVLLARVDGGALVEISRLAVFISLVFFDQKSLSFPFDHHVVKSKSRQYS